METLNDCTIFKHTENIELYTLNRWWVWNVNFSIKLFTKKCIFRIMGDLEYQVQGLLYNPYPKSQYSAIWFDAENFHQQWRALLLPLLFQKFNFIVASNTISTSILRIWLCSYCQCCCFQRKNLLLSFILPLVFEGNLTGNIWVTLLERSLGNWVSTFIEGIINLTLKEAIFFIPYKTQIRNSSDIKTDDA